MDEKQETEEIYRRRDQFEDEIELIDYLRVLWKWKWFIILGTFACMVVAAIISLIMPKVYEVSMTLEPGIVGLDTYGKFIYIDSRQNIEGKIKRGIYNTRIQNALNINPIEKEIKFEVAREMGTNFIKVGSEWKDNNVKLGIKSLSHLYALLSKEYEKVVEQRMGDYEKRILMKQNQIKEIEIQRKDIDKQILLKLNKIDGKKNHIRLNKATLKIIEHREKELLQEIKDVKDNTERIVKQRNSVLQHKSNVSDISLLLYSTTIQQNVAYFNQLSNQINDLRTKKEIANTKIENLNKDIVDINTEIDRLKLKKTEGLQAKIYDMKAQIDRLTLEKATISNVKFIQQPEVSPMHVKSKKKLKVLLAGDVGFMMMLFLAFFWEYIQKTKQNNLTK